jgi:hypothetical protein
VLEFDIIFWKDVFFMLPLLTALHDGWCISMDTKSNIAVKGTPFYCLSKHRQAEALVDLVKLHLDKPHIPFAKAFLIPFEHYGKEGKEVQGKVLSFVPTAQKR